jgi:hypothetical protein
MSNPIAIPAVSVTYNHNPSTSLTTPLSYGPVALNWEAISMGGFPRDCVAEGTSVKATPADLRKMARAGGANAELPLKQNLFRHNAEP